MKFLISRRQVLVVANVAFVVFALVHEAAAQTVALTFDDGPKLEETPIFSPLQRNQRILEALAKHHVKAALFVTADNGASRPEGYAFAKAWGLSGHAVGNHTMTHPDLNNQKLTLEQYQEEILDCDKIIKTLPGYQKWFRYTYLREGNTPEKRDGVRSFLSQQGYRNAYVSLDTSDWRFNDKLTEILSKNPRADITPIKQLYLAHIQQRALAYRQLSQQLQGRDIPHVMLLHHNLTSALWLDDVMTQFEKMGWKFVSPTDAYADPVYQLKPELPATGQSMLLSMARSLGMGNFAGRQRLIDDADFEMAELKE